MSSHPFVPLPTQATYSSLSELPNQISSRWAEESFSISKAEHRLNTHSTWVLIVLQLVSGVQNVLNMGSTCFVQSGAFVVRMYFGRCKCLPVTLQKNGAGTKARWYPNRSCLFLVPCSNPTWYQFSLLRPPSFLFPI